MNGDYFLPVEEVIQLMSEPPQEIPPGVKMIGAELEWPETKGKGIRVCVIDTGAPNHPDIKLAGQVDFTGEGPLDERGHSTHVCGILAANGRIKGVAPEVELSTAKVFPKVGGASFGAIVSALDWCRANKMDVINMSLGGPTPNASVEAACKRCEDAGILIVASAGNFGNDYPIMYPAEYASCLSTSAVDLGKQHADFSSRGEFVELAAAGVRIYSTWLNGQYLLLDGTSMAAPHIAGAAALMIDKYQIRFGVKPSPQEIRRMMAIYAEDLGDPGRDRKFGYGVFSFGRVEGGQPTPDRPKTELTFRVGEARYWKNGVAHAAHIAPRIIDSRTLVGLRDVGEAFGCQVGWVAPDLIKIRG